jgi:hypothetical protein
MKRSILTILIICLALPVSNAQLWKMRRWEALGGIGPSFFFGDIGGFSRTKNILGLRDLSFMQTRFDINGNLKYRVSRDVNLRLSLTYGMFHATDIRGSNEGRNFESSTSIFEPALIGEYYFIKNYAENSYLFLKQKQGFMKDLFRSLDFYAFAGFGGLSYNVKGNATLDAWWAANGKKNSGFTAVIPAGLGTTLIYSPNLNFGLEFGGRYAFSDYLDGYTSQYSRAKDVYYFLNFTVTFKLKSGPNGLPSLR